MKELLNFDSLFPRLKVQNDYRRRRKHLGEYNPQFRVLLGSFFGWVLWWFMTTVLESRAGLLALAAASYLLCQRLLNILVFIPLKHRHALYLVTDYHVTVQFGALSIHRKTVPLTRVQNVTTRVGFIDGYFGLADVVLSTAGNSVSIPNIPIEDAERIRTALLARLSKSVLSTEDV